MSNSLTNSGRIPFAFSVPAIFVSLVGMLFAIVLDQALLIVPGVLGFVFIAIMFYNKKIWLYSIAALTSVFFLSSSEGVSVLDVFVGIYFFFGIAIWIFWTVFVRKKKIVNNYRDWFLLFFFIVLIGNAIVAFFNEVDLFNWLREYIVFALTLYYFPLKEEFENKKDIEILLFLFSISVLAVSFGQFYTYYKILTSDDFMYAYQLGTSVRENQTVLTISVAVAVLFSFGNYSKLVKLYSLTFAGISFTALVITFSRTFWVVEIFLLFLVFLFISYRQKILFSVYTLILVLFTVITAFLFFQDNAKIFYSFVEKRFTSSTKGTKDISLLSRLAEYDAAIDRTYPDNMLGGNGLSAEFHFYDPIPEMTKRTNIIHNGYIYFFYRIGAPLTLVYLFVMVATFLKAFELSKQITDPFFKKLAVTGFMTMLMLFIVNTTSSQFVYRDGIFVVAFGLAVTAIAEKYQRKSNTPV